MKTRLALLLALLFTGRLALPVGAQNLAAEMAVNAELQEAFFARHPDLADERETVTQAARALSTEGTLSRNEAEASALLAERTRVLLARRTPQEWQHKAVSLFPELGVPGSEFNQLFLRHHEEMQRTSPQFTKEPSWPVLLAKRCADELRPGAPPVEIAAPPGVPTNPGTVTAPETTAAVQRSPLWLSALNLVLLLAIVGQPALWMGRGSRAFGGNEGPAAHWQWALRPAAWAYLAVALVALWRTFTANADLGFLDRFGITLLVSVLAGLVIAVPVFAGAWAVGSWRRRKSPEIASPLSPRTAR